MKELDPNKLPQKDKTENIREFPKENKHVGSMRSIPGLALWELNLIDKTIKPAEMENSVTLEGFKHKKVNIKKGHLYVQALNIKTAIKKFGKRYPNPQIWAILETIIIKQQIKL
jgi:hypothetical protein